MITVTFFGVWSEHLIGNSKKFASARLRLNDRPILGYSTRFSQTL